MIKLYGAAFSNMFNAVKLALLEKGFDFEEIETFPSQKPEYLQISPMGKIPVLEVNEGFLSETNTILEFLEDINPEMPLFPEDAYERAKVRELMKVFELYIDAPARKLVPAVMRGKEVSEEQYNQVRAELERGIAAVGRLAALNPHLAEGDYSFADIYGYYTLGLARWVSKAIYQWDVAREVDGLVEWYQRMAANPFVKSIDETASSSLARVMQK